MKNPPTERHNVLSELAAKQLKLNVAHLAIADEHAPRFQKMIDASQEMVAAIAEHAGDTAHAAIAVRFIFQALESARASLLAEGLGHPGNSEPAPAPENLAAATKLLEGATSKPPKATKAAK